MRAPIFEVVVGDVREVLKGFPGKSIHCVVTSPPYWALRDYEGSENQIGLEQTFEEWVETIVGVFREVRRVLRDDGTCWVNIGASYAGARSFQGKADGTDGVFARRAARLDPTGKANGTDGVFARRRRREGEVPEGTDDAFARRDVRQGGLGHKLAPGWKNKDLCMQGPLVAEALRRDGWYLRSHIAWIKNAMPESITDRPANTWEHVHLLAKSEDYFFDAEAVRTITKDPTRTGHVFGGREREREPEEGGVNGSTVRKTGNVYSADSGANLRNVWRDPEPSADEFLQDLWDEFLEFVGERLSTQTDEATISNEPFPGKHFAVFSTKLVERCVKAGTSEKGCCSSCGAPWKRTVTKGEPDREHQIKCGSDADGNYLGESTKDHDDVGVQDASAVKARILAGMRSRISTWAPGCACVGADGKPLEPQPCLVLDPFTGSGRTGKVALALGRDFVGVELVSLYADMARANIADPLWEKKERARIRAERAAEKARAAATPPTPFPLDSSVTIPSAEVTP